MAESPPDAVYAKTPMGSDEVATRRHGLGMRVRQLLILVDGRRSVADLAKLVPEKDLAAHLALLEQQGFVARADAPPAGAPAAAGGAAPVAPAPGPGLVAGAPLGLFAGARIASPPASDPGPVTLARGGPSTLTGGPSTRTRGPATQAGGPATRPGGPDTQAGTAAAAPAPAPQRRDLETLRRAVVRHLVDAIGPHADDMAVRVERCRSVDELRQILPSVAGLVEAVRGRAAMAAFLQRVGPL
jgi:hypothetical protein